MVNILLTRSMLDQDIRYIKDGLDQKIKEEYNLIIPESFTEDILCQYINDIEIILGPYITRKMIEKGTRLKMMQVPWTGIDTVNISALKDSNIILCNSHSNSNAVAELGIALTIDLLKKVTYHHNKLSKGNWNRDNEPLNLKSRMLCNEKIAIIGCGHIGLKLAKLYSAFGAKVKGFHEKENSLIDGVEILNMCYLYKYLKDTTILVSTVPLVRSTEKMINSELISKLDSKCLIINLSRAEIVDEYSIFKALMDSRIGGFASDVWWNTPKRGETQSFVSTKYDFSQFSNVIMSPHRAGFIENSLPHLDDAIENIIRYVKKEELINIIKL